MGGNRPEVPRLLVVVNVFEPDLGGGVLFSDLCYGLAERGFEVTARCAYPYYPEWRDKSGRNGLRIDVQGRNGVRIERFGIYIPHNPNSLAERLLYETSFFASLLRRLPRRGEFDAVMVFCPLMGAVAYAALYKRAAGIPLWLNVQDLPAEAAMAGGISAGAAARSMLRVEDALFNEADVWSTISPAMVESLRGKRRRKQSLLYIPNWLHTSLADLIAANPSKLGRPPSRPPRLLYSGNIGTKQNLLELCRVLHAGSADFQFRIQGEGSEAGSVRTWLQSVGDARFQMHGLSDEPDLARALHDTDFFVITERGESGGSFIPSKLIPALAAETPILAVCDATSPLGQEMNGHRLGPQFDWRTVGQVPEMLASNSPEAYVDWQGHAARRAAFYDRDRVIDLYAGELRNVLRRETDRS